jgi:hypothetical protein
LFGAEKTEAVEDALFLNQCCFEGANWFIAPTLLAGPKGAKPEPVKKAREKLPRLREISARYASAQNAGERELHKVATWIVERWKD